MDSPKSFFAFDCNCQGYSHIKANKICQDYSLSYNNDHFAVAIISDGHGGDDYFRSDIGSKLAVEITMDCVKEFIIQFDVERVSNEITYKYANESLIQLEKSIVAKWRAECYEHYKDNSFTDEEMKLISDKAKQKYEKDPTTHFIKAYGSTLLVAVIVKNKYWFAIQLGDGKCVAILKNGHVKHFVPINEKCFLNQTTSLCDESPIDEFNHYFSEKAFPKWLFVGSDGVDDSFKDDTQLNNFYKEVAKTFKNQTLEKSIEELKAYLPILSQKGSGDDISISGIYNN